MPRPIAVDADDIGQERRTAAKGPPPRARGAAARTEAHRERMARAPRCPARVRDRQGRMTTCRVRMTRNAVEAERGVCWCPRCRSYTRPEDRAGFGVLAGRR